VWIRSGDDMIVMRYTESGIERIYHYEDSKLDELLLKADAKFCTPATAADIERHRRAVLIGQGEERTRKGRR